MCRFENIGKMTTLIDIIHYLVLTAKSVSRYLLSNHVGIGSRLHEVEGDLIILSLAESSEPSAKQEI